jgi:endonuclease/exonuclease/phosphatase family metal-dependent hydrolase
MTDTTRRQGRIILFAIFFLFLIQLWGMLTEGIYRLSLIKLSSGTEMLFLAFLFAPLLVLFLPGNQTKRTLVTCTVLAFVARLLLPFLGLTSAAAVAGFGTGAGLIALTILLSGPFRLPGDAAALGIGLALLGSIALRAWGSSLDFSMTIPGTVITLALMAVAVYELRARGWGDHQALPQDRPGVFKALFATVGLFANFLFLYLAFFNPAVMSAWIDANYAIIITLVVLGWTAMLLIRPAVPHRGSLILANALFATSLAGTLYLYTPAFPTTPESPALTVTPPSFFGQLPLFLACLLSPVIYFNLRTLFDHAWTRTPRGMAIPVLLGALLMMTLTLMLIYTNVWGYVGPIGESLRGKFYLPFLLAGAVSLVTIAVSARYDFMRGVAVRPALVGTVAAIALIGVFARGYATSDDAIEEPRLTILTYNMQQGSAEEGDINWQAQLDFIKAVNADIIGLQESDSPRPSGGGVDPSRYFADALGYHRYFGPATVGGTYGTAILSRFPLENPRTFYTFSDEDEIGTAVAEVEVLGSRIAFFNSHPAGGKEAKQAHVDALVDRVREYDHIIAVGDYNFRQDSPWYATVADVLIDPWLQLHPDATGPRHPAIGQTDPPSEEPLDMTRRIDHIFLSDTFNIEEAWYVPVPQSETDHPAHWVVVSW